MKKMIFGLFALFSFLLYPLNSNAEAIKFRDVGINHWANEDISFLSSKGIIYGNGKGLFLPNDSITVEHGIFMVERVTKKEVTFLEEKLKKPITRGEVAILLENSFDLSEGETYDFNDVSKSDPYYQAINKLASNQIVIGYEDGSFKPDKTVSRAEFSAFIARIMDVKFRKVVALKQQAKQRILVTSTSLTTATVQLQEFNGVKWQNVNKTFQAVIGKNGTGKTREGDGKTPSGTYALGTLFGWGQPIHNPNYSFRSITSYDYWVDDVNSKEYNKWIYYGGDPKKRWNSYEKMNHPLYKYGVVIRYNEDPIVSGKGSAIFLHMKNSTTKYTQGCIALNENDLTSVIKWLNKNKKPIIIIR